jgi:hypothetical protein
VIDEVPPAVGDAEFREEPSLAEMPELRYGESRFRDYNYGGGTESGTLVYLFWKKWQSCFNGGVEDALNKYHN